MSTSPIIVFIADPNEPDIYNDVNSLPNPFTMNIPVGITNTATSTLYLKISLVDPPAAYLDYMQNLGSLAPSESKIFTFPIVRQQPTLTDGEYEELLIFQIDIYSDEDQSVLYGTQTLEAIAHHFDHDDASWTVVAHDTFDGADQDSWAGTNVIRTAPGDPFYSSPAALQCPWVSNGNRTWSAYKDYTVGSVTKARIVIHYYTTKADGDQQTDVLVDNVCKMPQNLQVPPSRWVRFAFNMFKNKTGRIYVTNFSGATGIVLIDEIWVIAK